MAVVRHRKPGALVVASLVCFAASSAFAQQAAAPASTPIEVRGGTATFDVGTNVPALSVHGKSQALEARGRIRTAPDGPRVEQIEATLPVSSLGTGMGLRDDHMRKYVFTTPDGQTPDVKFTAKGATCAKAGDRESTCEVTGDLSIRGTSRPFTLALKVREDNGAYRASGDGVVKLSAYGIPQPSQLGVRTDDEVKLRLDFTARPAPVGTSGVKR